MKNKWNKKIVCLAAAALVLVASLSIGDALAYFSTYVVSEGEKPLVLKFADTVINEEVVGGKKIVAIQNNGAADCYVRVKVIVAGKNTGKITVTEPAGNNYWTDTADAKGYYYYEPIVTAAGTDGNVTTPLYVEIAGITSTPDAAAEDFNVIVIQECTPVLYRADDPDTEDVDEGGMPYADWDGSDFSIEKVQEGEE